MSIEQPTPEQARTAIAEAGAAQEPVRSSDRLFAPRLLALATAVVGLTALIAIFGALPNWMGPIEGLLAGLGIAGAAWLVVSAGMRQHAYTRPGNLLFTGTLLVFLMWGQLVMHWTFTSGWTDYHLPYLVRTAHFMLSAVVAVVPLLIGALLFWRRR